MNKVILMGRITKKPELWSYDTNSKCSTFFRIAVDEGKDKSGNKLTTFVPIKSWDKTAEYICKYAEKGDLVSILGRYTNYESTKDGVKTVSTYTTATEFKIESRAHREQNDQEVKAQEQSQPVQNKVVSELKKIEELTTNDDYLTDVDPFDDF